MAPKKAKGAASPPQETPQGNADEVVTPLEQTTMSLDPSAIVRAAADAPPVKQVEFLTQLFHETVGRNPNMKFVRAAATDAFFPVVPVPNEIPLKAGVFVGHGRDAAGKELPSGGADGEMGQMLIAILNLAIQQGDIDGKTYSRLKEKSVITRVALLTLLFGDEAKKFGGKNYKRLADLLDKLSGIRFYMRIEGLPTNDGGYLGENAFSLGECRVRRGKYESWAYTFAFSDIFLSIMKKCGLTHEINMLSLMKASLPVAKTLLIYLPNRAKYHTQDSPMVTPLRELLKEIKHADAGERPSRVRRVFERHGEQTVVDEMNGAPLPNNAKFHCFIPPYAEGDEVSDVLIYWVEGNVEGDNSFAGTIRSRSGDSALETAWAEGGGDTGAFFALINQAKVISDDLADMMEQCGISSSFATTYSYLVAILGERFVLDCLSEAKKVRVANKGGYAWVKRLVPAVVAKARQHRLQLEKRS